jgi:hypothetical protein
MGPGSIAQDASPCPEYRRDYVKLSAWVLASLFGPALVVLLVWLV